MSIGEYTMTEGKVTISIQIRKEHTYIHNSFEHLTESEVSKLSEKFYNLKTVETPSNKSSPFKISK